MELQCIYRECHPHFPSILHYNANANDQCSFVWISSTRQQRPTNKRIIHTSLCPKDLHNECNKWKLGSAFKVNSLFQFWHKKKKKKIETVVVLKEDVFSCIHFPCVFVQCQALLFYLGSKVRDEKEGKCLRWTKIGLLGSNCAAIMTQCFPMSFESSTSGKSNLGVVGEYTGQGLGMGTD